ncbi:hypothetical protein FMEAI12_5150006 [Parafrankia sp. Ea1.12]|nr:hypothetical protein FMEAI12_5150006 [Parafrankia sp. Ea1.12]
MSATALLTDNHANFCALASVTLTAGGYRVVGDAGQDGPDWPRRSPSSRTSCCSSCSFPTSTASRQPSLIASSARPEHVGQ